MTTQRLIRSGCDRDAVYFVFHGMSKSKRPQDAIDPPARTTIVGHGETTTIALDDAKAHEHERGYDFYGVAHISGPHRPVPA